jgi:regulator of protease activity HflC (stomatin/prohibitin superfamily)
MEDNSIPKMNILIAGAVALVIAIALCFGLFEDNPNSHYKVKQSIMGQVSFHNESGPFWQGFGHITDYPKTGLISFAADKLGGGGSFPGLPATFRGNSRADISGILKYQLSADPKNQMSLYTRYGSAEAVKETLVKQALAEALIQTGPLFSPEEAFVTRRSEFTATTLAMLRKGIFKTYTEDIEIKTDGGEERTETITKIERGADGIPVISKPSALLQYGIDVIDFNIRDFAFDDLTDKLIDAKKEAEQQKVVARANAEKAKQDAITAAEQGKALVAKAKAEEDVKKIKSVVEAQKNFEVSEFQKKQAEQEAKAKILQGEAEAHVARLKVSAGLSPLERATIDKETAIGVAKELAGVQFPESLIVVGGGSNGGGRVNPFDAVGLESFYDLTKKMSGDRSSGSKSKK